MVKNKCNSTRTLTSALSNQVCMLAANLTILAGCATIPDAKITYYHPKSIVNLKINRIGSCTADNKIVFTSIVNATSEPTVSNEIAGKLDLSSLHNGISDTDIKFDFHEGGRIKGVNSSSIGQGQEIVEGILKAVTAIAKAVIGFAFVDTDGKMTQQQLEAQLKAEELKNKSECESIKLLENGTINLTYEGEIDPTKLNILQDIKPDAKTAILEQSLMNKKLPRITKYIKGLCAEVVSIEKPEKPIDFSPVAGLPTLNARQPGFAKIVISNRLNGRETPECENMQAELPEPNIWEGKLYVAQIGTNYQIPLPMPASFGKNSFALSLSESGALLSVQYANTSGAKPAIDSANSLVDAVRGNYASEKTNKIKDEIDSIIQQQRLVKCIAKPSECQ